MEPSDARFRIYDNNRTYLGTDNTRDTTIQVILSLALGIGAFLSFCILRLRWSELYAARNKHKDQALPLPELPHSLFGWIPALWRINDQQVLASAGLDAYVFLAFFTMAIKFLLVTTFFALVVIKPVHDNYPDPRALVPPKHENDTTIGYGAEVNNPQAARRFQHTFLRRKSDDFKTDYLWMYLVFAYFYSIIAMYLIIADTRKVIEVRQAYLGSQSTVTDRTIQLSGIPAELRSEGKIKEFIEELEIGKVESVFLCRKWKELDQLMIKRGTVLRKLEEALTVYLGSGKRNRGSNSLPISQPHTRQPMDGREDDNHEAAPLMGNGDRERSHPYSRNRPKTRIWYGRFNLRSKLVDAINYYEEKLKKLDEDIKALRQKEFEPTPLAFVTMDSVASCQMAIQAVLDPSPLQLLAKSSPAPTDVIWRNTYLSRSERMMRAWSITLIVTVLTVFWSVLLLPVTGALNLETIRKAFPQLADTLESHPTAKSLVKTQLPTLLVSLLTIAVPYLYDWLANQQGIISQADVELSVISKNFFFTFFNVFVILTILGTAWNFKTFLLRFGDLKDATQIAYTLAQSLQQLLGFYGNLVILQALGLFPLRLLEVGSLALYPVGLVGAKTPRDYAELVQPPAFSFGFYVPQTLLIFIICIVYSVLRSSWVVLLAGLAYFVIGRFVYKYQLLYAMNHLQHSTGRGWIMMCNRVLLGLVLFQLTMAGQLALKGAIKRSIIVLPLLCATIWFIIAYNRTYRPLISFIALKSIRRVEHSSHSHDGALNIGELRYDAETRHHQTVDESRESGLRFINPSLIAPLEKVWIKDVRRYNEQSSHLEPDPAV